MKVALPHSRLTMNTRAAAIVKTNCAASASAEKVSNVFSLVLRR